MKKLRFTLPLFALIVLLAACGKKAEFNFFYYTPEDYAVISQKLDLPDPADNYTVQLPKHLQQAGLFARPSERDKAVLGRVLFYDKNLSKDGKISCGSCHKQELGFGDNKALSDGVNGQSSERNSIALASVANFSAYYGTDINGPLAIRFLWDNRAETAAQQSMMALNNPKEMDMHSTDILNAVAAQDYYKPLFRKAFNSEEVTADRVTEAISNFINAIGSHNSRFDEGANALNYNEPYTKAFTNFTVEENAGKLIYVNKCGACHGTAIGRPQLNNANNGLDATSADLGVGAITNYSNDNGTFKVPTLRNITLSAPYMHDGRFATLEEVVDHYSTGIKNHPNLHASLKDGGDAIKMDFTAKEKSDLIAFLNTLTDTNLKEDKRFSDPFKK